jgi:hypothetical protein
MQVPGVTPGGSNGSEGSNGQFSMEQIMQLLMQIMQMLQKEKKSEENGENGGKGNMDDALQSGLDKLTKGQGGQMTAEEKSAVKGFLKEKMGMNDQQADNFISQASQSGGVPSSGDIQ